MPLLGDIPDTEERHNNRVCYQSVRYLDQTYKIGDCAYFHPAAFTFPQVPALTKKDKPQKNKDVGLFC